MVSAPIRRVADFPRPPAIEAVTRRIRIVLGGETIADTGAGVDAGLQILETTHPPTYYVPLTAFRPGSVSSSARSSFCEWKGAASYVSLIGGGKSERDSGWLYPNPTAAYAALRGHVAVYAWRMDGCFLDDERVTPQPGGFYGGWITADLVGPFKGAPGTEFW
jgi:uncharacterized protein (DUF427 family)